MALQALKGSSCTAARVFGRMGPPGSPSRNSSSQATVKPAMRARILDALASDMLLEATQNALPLPVFEYKASKAVRAGGTAVPKPIVSRERPTFTTYRGSGKPATADDSAFPSTGLEPKPAPAPPQPSRAHQNLPASTEPATTKDAAAKTEESEPKPKQLYSYKDYKPLPKLVYVRNEEEANKLVDTLKGPLGFDLEWKVLLRRGVPAKPRRTALIQLCDRETILIVQVSAMKTFPQKVKEIIENPSIPKIGANILNDGKKLARDFNIAAANLVELGALGRQTDLQFEPARSIVSLANITERFCDGKVLAKGPVRVSDWERIPLTVEQLQYAANDAHSALMAYRRMMSLAAIGLVTLDPRSYSSSVLDQPSVAVSPDGVEELVEAAPREPSEVQASTSTQPASAARPSATTAGNSYTISVDKLPRAPLHVVSPQAARAYKLWHHRETPLAEMCGLLRSKENPLQKGTVISHVVRALQVDSSLPYSMERLKALVREDPRSWIRHRDWITQQESTQS